MVTLGFDFALLTWNLQFVSNLVAIATYTSNVFLDDFEAVLVMRNTYFYLKSYFICANRQCWKFENIIHVFAHKDSCFISSVSPSKVA